jgi:hypothetical protein
MTVFANRMLRRIFGPKREKMQEVGEDYDEELHNLYASQNIIRMINSRWMRWVGHVTCM